MEISLLILRIPLIAWLALLPYTAQKSVKARRETMDQVTCAVILFLGAVATVIIVRVLFLVAMRPSPKNLDDQYLQRIANALQ